MEGNYMVLSSIDVPAEVKDLLGRVGLSRVFDELRLAGDSFIQSEQTFRKSQRVLAAGFHPAVSQAEGQNEAVHNSDGLAHLATVLSEIANTRRQFDPGMIHRIDMAATTDDFRQAVLRARDNVVHQLIEVDLLPEDFREIVSIWDSHSQHVTSSGLSGVLNHLEETIRRARDVRSQPDRGRQRGSIPMWKAIIIASVLVLALGMVLACFIWAGCAAVTAIAGLAGGEGGIVFALLNAGC
jgi:hypothetical protein